MNPYDDNRQFEDIFQQPGGQQYGPGMGPGFGQQFGSPFGLQGGPFSQFFGQMGIPGQFNPPGGGPPIQPPGLGGMQPPGLGFQGGGMQPPGPPPSYTPSITTAQSLAAPGGIGVYAVDPGAIRFCRFKYTYIWLVNGQQFWSWLTFVGRRSVAGWRWIGFRWVYFGVDLDQIQAFQCF